MNLIFFSSKEEFRKWLEENHTSEKELYVGFWKKSTGRPTLTWSESVDQALCFGWIDGIRKSLDGESYCNRFTPRRPGSNWSRVNIAKMEALQKSGEMTPAGLEVFIKRDRNKDESYSYEQQSVILAPEFDNLFRKNKQAWTFFEKQPPSYKKPRIQWINGAKQEETKLNRLKKLIKWSEEGKRLF